MSQVNFELYISELSRFLSDAFVKIRKLAAILNVDDND